MTHELCRIAGFGALLVHAASAFAQAPPATVPATAPGDAAPEVFDATTALSALPKVLPEDLKLGPLNFTFGPQENGDFGAILSGGDSIPINSLRSHTNGDFPDTNFWRYYGAVEYSVDASWASGAGALNQSTISLKPQLTLVSMKPGTQLERVLAEPSNQALCIDLASKLDPNDPATFSSEVLEPYVEHCPLKGKAPGERFAISLMADAQYRYGEFRIDGARYEANQLLIGGGFRAFLPQATRSAIFREVPRLSVMYYSVSDSSRSTLPDPEGFELNTISAQTRLRLRVPLPGMHTGLSPVHLDVDLRASKQTEGDNRDWEYFREFQLSVDVGQNQWKPALTYRSGDDMELQYDRQIILGMLVQLLK